jgi:hypothetical protein
MHCNGEIGFSSTSSIPLKEEATVRKIIMSNIMKESMVML